MARLVTAADVLLGRVRRCCASLSLCRSASLISSSWIATRRSKSSASSFQYSWLSIDCRTSLICVAESPLCLSRFLQ